MVQTAASTLDFEAKSSLHPVHGKATHLSGFVVAHYEGDALALDPSPEMHVEFPVERLGSGNVMQDKEMWKLLESKRSPLIRADLRDLRPFATNEYAANGEITMCGRSRRYDGTLRIACADAEMTVDGDLRLDIRDFGIVPPRFLMFSVQPEVKIRLHLVAKTA